MTSRDFCYWLQGMFEIADPKSLNEQSLKIIKNQLNMVFIHEIDPSFPKDQAKMLNKAHKSNESLGQAKPITEDTNFRC